MQDARIHEQCIGTDLAWPRHMAFVKQCRTRASALLSTRQYTSYWLTEGYMIEDMPFSRTQHCFRWCSCPAHIVGVSLRLNMQMKSSCDHVVWP